MRLCNIEFPPICNSAGAQGFYGEGYPYHRLWKLFGLSFKNCGFVAKTTTIESRLEPEKGLGNMPLKENGITPSEWKPKCIVVNPLTGDVLNAVGLSGPGASSLLARNEWQRRNGAPWYLSFMSVQPTRIKRIDQLKEWVTFLKPSLLQWNSRVALELNFSCPNVNLEPSTLLNEIGESLDIAGRLRIPLQIKVNALAPANAIAELSRHPNCNAVTMGNTIPWGQLPDQINWPACFGTDISPLASLGSGGLSGPRLVPVHSRWIREARACGLNKPIIGCGGIYTCRAIDEYAAAGSSAIQIGSVAIVRPWHMRKLISYGHHKFSI